MMRWSSIGGERKGEELGNVAGNRVVQTEKKKRGIKVGVGITLPDLSTK